ncbi:MAG: iron uptake system protein EfeO, partial [Mycobacterium sp.]
MNLNSVLAAKSGVALVAVTLAAASLGGCAANQKDDNSSTTSAATDITVTATDNGCELSKTEVVTGRTTFVITNNGAKVTEFYVYGQGQRVMGEVENISPGLQRKLVVNLNEPGKYQTACKPGMVGDGIRGDFTVTGETFTTNTDGKFQGASENYKQYVTTQTDALVSATEAFVAAIKARDIASAKSRYPTSREPYERIEPVAESFPDDLDPRIDLREADLEPGQRWTGFHRLEKDLWVTGIQPDTDAIADQLVADVRELYQQAKSPEYTIDTTQIAGGAQGLLDEVAISKITGEEDIFSHTDLWDFNANVEGSQAAVGSVRPILDQRDASLGKHVDQRFAEVFDLLGRYRQGVGFVLYDTVGK